MDSNHLLKKYPSLKLELADVVSNLEANPTQGTPLGNDFYKIRIAITSKNKGKSGGGRIIINIQFSHGLVYLLSIFDKSEKATVTNAEIKDLLKYIL